MNPLISIVIPCYNAGEYLIEAIESVVNHCVKGLYEIIIVNDGSTDQTTLAILETLGSQGHKVLKQENKGPGAARNAGVKYSRCEYILFLDSDNKIRSGYIEKGIEILDNHPQVGVVYGNAAFFGTAIRPEFISRKFDVYRIYLGNYIDVCSVVRKKAWEEVGGFDENRLLMGHEDWEFWIHLHSKGWKFHYVDETLFDYRLNEGSLWSQKSDDANICKVTSYVYTKHLNSFVQQYRGLYTNLAFYRNDKKRPFRSFLKYFYHKYFRKGFSFND